MDRQRSLAHTIKRLRRSWGLRHVRVHLVDAELRTVCGVTESDSSDEVRRKVADTITAAINGLPEESRIAVEVQLGLHPRAQYRTLTERARWLEQHLGSSERTTVRRMDEALDMLAANMLRLHNVPHPNTAIAGSIHVKSFKANLNLKGDTPEALEERVVVAATDNVREIPTSISVPRRSDDDSSRHTVEVDLLYGGSLHSREQPHESYFRQVIALPEPLDLGQEHEYLLRVKLPKGQPLAPHYVHVPFRRCDYFSLRVQFHPERVPRRIWVVSGVPTAVIYERGPGADVVEVNRIGEVHVEFHDLAQGLGYGICWQE